MNKKRLVQTVCVCVFAGVSAAALADTLNSSQQVTNPGNVIDGNYSNYGYSVAGASPSYCPSGFGYAGGKCQHSGSGTEFTAYIQATIDTYPWCAHTIELKHQSPSSFPSKPAAQTHVYFRAASESTWQFAGTITSATNVLTSQLSAVLYPVWDDQVVVVLGRVPGDTRSLSWYELDVLWAEHTCGI
jgi:hypothetical protein